MNINQLVETLSELRFSSILIQSLKSDDEIKSIMKKYDMLFFGERFNIINSIDLFHCLKNYFEIEVKPDELNKLIPIACTSLKMNIEPMVKLSNLSNSDSSAYMIELW